MAGKPLRSARTLSAREWRTIVGGLLIVLGALVGTRWIGPRWAANQRRAAEIARDRDQLARLKGLAASRAPLERSAAAVERALATRPRRLLHAATPALGGSALQQYLESAVEGAGMLIDRVEITPDPEDASGSGIRTVAASLSVIGDIHGVAALLASVASGPRAVLVERLAIRRNSALRGAPDVLQVTIGLRAPLLIDGGVP
jgi:hypothetical protein